MADIIIATGSEALVTEIEAALGGVHVIHWVRRGAAVVQAIAEINPDLVLLDFQIGNMGGVAACLAVRQEEEAGRLYPCEVYLLLDREVDVFLANRACADGVLHKPINSFQSLRTIENALMPLSKSG